MLISEAYAQSAGGGGGAGGGGLNMIIMMVLIFVVFYFMLIRPQQKRMKDQKAMFAALRRGDKVVTAGGIIGTVTKVIDDIEVQIEISPDVKVRIQRQAISAVESKGQPAANRGGGAGGKKEAATAGGDAKPRGLLDRLKRP